MLANKLYEHLKDKKCMELIGMYMHLKTTYLPTEVPTVMTNHVLSDNQLNKVNVSIEIAILLPKVQKY